MTSQMPTSMPSPPPFPARLPLFFDLSRWRVLLVGAGPIATGKLRPLREAGAGVRSVAIRHDPAFLAEADRLGGVELLRRPFEPADLDGARLAVSATGDPEVNAQVAAAARSRGIPVNAVDDPPFCDFHFCAGLRRGPWHLAIGTQGAFPGLSRVLREVLEELIPAEHEGALEELVRLRDRLKRADPERRRRALEHLLRELRQDYFAIEKERA
jgi:precorrin-2 dehydrogenase / sirohydrochlorin ferrochelatase